MVRLNRSLSRRNITYNNIMNAPRVERIKINGIILTTEPEETERLNLEEVKKKLRGETYGGNMGQMQF